MKHVLTISVWAGLLVIAAHNVRADPPGDRLIDEVVRAYEQTRQYDAQVSYTMVERNGQWLNKRRATLDIAWDRDANRLKIDDPDYLVVVDGDVLRTRLHDTPLQYVEATGHQPIVWPKLAADVPPLTQRLPIDVVLGFAQDPVRTLSDGFSRAATLMPPDPDDAQQRRRLRFNTDAGRMTLVLGHDPALVEQAVIELGGAAGGSGRAIVYDWTVRSRNQSLPEETFAFDTTGAQQVASFGDLNPWAGGGRGGGGPGGGPPAQPAMAVPDVELPRLDGAEKVNLSKLEQPVAVLAYFTTWAPPCGEQVKQVEAFFRKSQEQDWPVDVYLIDLFEEPAAVKAVVDDLGLETPILLDFDGVSAGPLGVLGVPQTLVIHGGEVVARYGESDTLTAQLEQDVQRLAAQQPLPDTGIQPEE